MCDFFCSNSLIVWWLYTSRRNTKNIFRWRIISREHNGRSQWLKSVCSLFWLLTYLNVALNECGFWMQICLLSAAVADSLSVWLPCKVFLSKQRSFSCVLQRLWGMPQENTHPSEHRPSEHPSLRRTPVLQNTLVVLIICFSINHLIFFFVYVLWEARQSKWHESVLEPRASGASPEGSRVSNEESKEEWEPSDKATGSWPHILSEQCLLSITEPSLQPHLERFVKSSAVACGTLKEGLILRNLSI